MTRATIGSLSHGGHALAHLDDGRVALVRDGCPGDEAEIELLGDHGEWLSARLVRVLDPSPSRIEPPCPYFGECGGCQWQHVDYDAQLASKTAIVSDALERIGGLTDVYVEPCIPSSRPYGYLNKVELLVKELDAGLRLGFRHITDESFVPVERCLLLPDAFQDAPRALTGVLRFLSDRTGNLPRRVVLRTATHTDDVEIAIWTTPGPLPRQLAAKALSDALPASGVVRVLVKGPEKKPSITGVEVLKGRGRWRERLAGHTFAVSAPTSFRINTMAAETLASVITEFLDPGPEDRLLDMYAGAGSFTLPSAERAGEVVAIESSSYALRDLRRNLERARLWASIVGGDPLRELGGLGRFDLAVVDAPEGGLGAEGLAALVHANPHKVAYISKDPMILARDTSKLVARGYHLVHAAPMDFSPQTYHVETIALLEKR